VKAARKPQGGAAALPEVVPLGMQPIEQGNLSSRAYHALREALIAGRFPPGHRLVMQELASQLGTSITPVREACQRLVSERGLELRSVRFAVVPELTLARYVEVRAIRIALEGMAASVAASLMPDAEIAELSTLHQRFEAADRTGDRETAIQANREFHFRVYRAAGMEMLTAQIESLWICMGPILNVYYREVHADYVGADEHVRLIEALRRRDGAAACLAIQQDILRGGQSILAHLSRVSES
jgi:DNA-binding GntR family transcriptional regulator